MPTLRCNIECPHCLSSCSPRSGDTMSPIQLKKWITEFIDIGFKPICLTGGECFLFPDLVRAASEICYFRSTPLVIQTNGFWASTYDRAIQTLKSIPYITQLGFSSDYSHMQFINREVVENGIGAAYECGIDNVSLSISYQTASERNEVSDYFRGRFPNLTIDAWPITPIGRALGNPKLTKEHDTYSIDFLPRSCEARTRFTPIVFPNGDVHLCYHLVMCLDKKDPFLAGNLSEKSLEEILENIEDPLFRFVMAYGGGSLRYLIEESAPELVSGEFQRVCQFCYAVFSDPKLVSKMRKILSLPQFIECTMEVMEYRFNSSKHSRLREKPAGNERIIICRGKNCFGKQTNAHLGNYLTNHLIDSRKWESATIEWVDCLHACGQGPNIKIGSSGKTIHHADKGIIDELIRSL
jgi:hypothetical protein